MAAPGENLKIDGARLWDSLMEMAKIGPGVAGGNNRQTLTDADAEGRALFQSWCDAAGCQMGVDKMGTMFARREGTDPDALPVYVGSHLDTQPTGGKYDGVLGVLGGAGDRAHAERPRDQDPAPHRGHQLDQRGGHALRPRDAGLGRLRGAARAGLGLRTAPMPRASASATSSKRIGWVGDEEVGARKMHAFFELHIEQGPILEAEGKDIGVVTHGQGLWWLEVRLTGKDAHTGSTPMPMRVNAGLGMARIIEMVHRIAMDHQPNAVGAVGQANVYPNSRNVIPGRRSSPSTSAPPTWASSTSMRERARA